IAALAAGDVNKDNKSDVALLLLTNNTPHELGSALALLGAGDGGFTVKTPASFGSAVIGYVPTLADIDGDGKLDFFTGGFYGNMSTASVVFGDGSGAFSTPVSTNLDGGNSAFVTGDLNADGKTDVIHESLYGGPLDVLLSQSRTFAPPQHLRT